jgi:glycosyltransferase involved in cell wall biosynthesis
MRITMLDLWCVVPYYTANLCNALAENGVDVRLASISYQYDPRAFSRLGVKNDPGLLDLVSKCGFKNARLRQALKLLECMVNVLAWTLRVVISRPDIIHVQFIPLVKKRLWFEFWFLQFAKFMGARLVYTVHNVLPMDTGVRYFQTFRRIYRRMDILICHTPDTRSMLMEQFGIPSKSIRVIPHGPITHQDSGCSNLQARSRLGLKGDELLVLWLGWIKPYKGVPVLLEAWRQVSEADPRARLIVAGSGEETLIREIRQKVTSLGIAGSVRLDLRFIPAGEVAAYYQAADVMVYPYTEITTSGALMTALSYGKAMIVSDLPAFREVVVDGESALLVPPQKSARLAEAILSLIRDPERIDRLSAAARSAARSRETSWEFIARNTRALYESILENSALEHALAPSHSRKRHNSIEELEEPNGSRR